MTEISEKELPFKLPLKAKSFSAGDYNIKDAYGALVCGGQTKEAADFICLACNSYFEQKKRIKELEGICKKSLKIINNPANIKKVWILDVIVLLETAQ